MADFTLDEYLLKVDKYRKDCLLALDGVVVSEDEQDLVRYLFSHMEDSKAFEQFEEFALDNPISVLKHDDNAYYQSERKSQNTVDVVEAEVAETIRNIVREDIRNLLHKRQKHLDCVIDNRGKLASMFEDIIVPDEIVTPFDVEDKRKDLEDKLVSEAKEEADNNDSIESMHPAVSLEDQPSETREFVDNYLSDNQDQIVPEIEEDVIPPRNGKLKIHVSSEEGYDTPEWNENILTEAVDRGSCIVSPEDEISLEVTGPVNDGRISELEGIGVPGGDELIVWLLNHGWHIE